MVDTPDYKNLTIDTDAAKVSTEAFNNTIVNSQKEIGRYTDFMGIASEALKNLASGLKSVAGVQQNNNLLTQQSTLLLGNMGNAALGASKAFGGMADHAGITNFTGQIETMVATAARTTGGLSALAKALHIPATDTIGKTTAQITELIKGVLAGPDAALKFQNGFLQMAAAGGGLGKVFQQTGGDLRNINDLLQTQSQMLGKAIQATNTDAKTTTEYYTALGEIPGYLNAQSGATEVGVGKLNMLTAAMKIAHGTGQEQRAIIGDLTKAYETYGASGEKALDFTARISELSQKYNVRLQDTREYMTRTAESFKFLGENVDSSAKMFESYFSRLRDTGLSTKAAVEVTDDMAGSLAKMTIAQKAFLSSRTGGPGGLMGAVQIEKDIRDGKMADVMKKVEDALKQQFGRIVTQQEATTSQQAAAQFVKQRMFLQQGPFGQLTGGDEGKATRLLEAFAKPGGVSQTDATKLLSDTVKRGSDVEQKSYTQFTQMNAQLEAIKMLSGIIALGSVQRGLTPGAGGKLEQQLIGGIKDAVKSGREAATQGDKRQQDDKSAVYMTQNTQGLFNVIGHLGDTLDASGKEIKAVMGDSKHEMAKQHDTTSTRAIADIHRTAAHVTTTGSAATHRDTHTADVLMAASKKHTEPPPVQNINVTMTSVCPDCHKKFVTNQHEASINNAPGQFGPGF